MVKPSRNTIGVKMLRKMGWREGQGVGPKIKRKLRKLKEKIAHGIKHSLVSLMITIIKFYESQRSREKNVRSSSAFGQ